MKEKSDKILVIITLFWRTRRIFETQIVIENRLCAHCILNQCLEFDQTKTNTLLANEKEVIRFWSVWLNVHGHFIIKTSLKWALFALCLMNQ